VLQLVAEARREERGEAAPQPERRRIRADQHGGETEPAEGEDGPGLGDTHAHRVPLAVEQRDLPQHLPRTGTCHLHRAIAGLLEPDREGAVDDEQHLSSGVPLAKEDLPLPHRAPAHHAGQPHQIRLAVAFEERDAGQELDGRAVRHPGRASRTRRRPS
jgi:hypothetical protein